ncbi:hypothetical protein EJB05_49544, partial [Eragrostis curvula]
MADLPSLDYSPGLGQQAEIWRRFRFPVVFSPNCGLGEFFLVLSVGRCKFRLTTFSVALILQAVLGGSAQSFKVEELRDRVYKFSVSCKKVGFYIYNLKSFECEAFKVLFHLWGNGGPQSLQEEQRWEQEQSNEWTEVLGKKKKKTYAEVTRSRNQAQSRGSKILSGANAVPIKQPLQKSARFCLYGPAQNFSGHRSPRVGNVNTKPRVNLRYIPKKALTPGASGGPRDQDINNEGNRAISFPGNPDSSPSLDLRLGTKNPETSSPPSPIQSTSQRASPEATPTPEESPMAYNHIDPAPFIPRLYERIEVPGRDTMVRAICGRAAPRNEDVAIARIHPMPHHQVPFIHIRDVLHDFFTQHIRIPVRSIQPCPFGQAYVRFESIQDRDMLADTGLHPFGDIDIKHIEAAIRPFAKLEIWEKDLGNLARILIRVKVATLESVPRWVVITEGHDFRSNSWTVQCEILTQRMLGNEPGDEDPVPPPEQVGDDQPFDFFGFGQQAFGHAVAPVNQELFDNGPQANNWGVWPDNEQNNAAEEDINFDLNLPADQAQEENMQELEAILQASQQAEQAEQVNQVVEPEVPDQLHEPQPQISLSLSDGPAQGSDSSVNVIADLNVVPDDSQQQQALEAVPMNVQNQLDLNIEIPEGAEAEQVEAVNEQQGCRIR